MLGPRIAALRRSKNISQGELAKRLQVSPSAVGMYEQGRREPSAELLVRLARVLEVSVDYLLTGQPLPGERERLEEMTERSVSEAEAHTKGRSKAPLSREELAVLFAALLLES
jgi:transcriptional regulator with XRE-family HTH domain